MEAAEAQHSASSSIVWKVNTRKCIDASPLLVLTRQHKLEDGVDRLLSFSSRSLVEDNDSVMVYVGSHSHLFVAIELATGREAWHTELPDRIESSACVSCCGSFIAVGEGHCSLGIPRDCLLVLECFFVVVVVVVFIDTVVVAVIKNEINYCGERFNVIF